MSLSSERLAKTRASLARIVEPVKVELAEIDQAISEIEAEIEAFRQSKLDELGELREARREAIALVRITDPDFRKQVKMIRKPLKGPDPAANAKRRTEALLAWLREHAGEDEIRVSGFTAKGLYDRRVAGDKSVPTMSRDNLGKTLAALADDGVIRLDRIGSGAAKIYKLVSRNGQP